MSSLIDYLFKGAANAGLWIRATNNQTSTSYVSTAATDSNGQYTLNPRPPAGTYTLASGPTSTGAWTNYDPAYIITDPISQPWFNVKDYGAVGDGTTDDTAAIQAAMNALPTASGGIVYFPAGIYKTSATLSLSLTFNPILRGAGKRASVIAPTTALAGLAVIEFVNCRDHKVENLNVRGVPSGTVATAAVRSRRASGGGGALLGSYLKVNDCYLGADAYSGIAYGVEWTADNSGVDTGNDQGEVYATEVNNFTGAAYHVNGINSLEHRVVGGVVTNGPSLVLLNGGSIDVMGTSIGALTSFAVDFQAPLQGSIYNHKSTFEFVAESPSPLVRSISGITSGPHCEFRNLDWVSATASTTMVDWQASGSVFSLLGCTLYYGQTGMLAQFTSATSDVRMVACPGLGFTTITYNGNLTLVANNHLPGGVTLTNSGSGTLVQVGDTGAGFAAAQGLVASPTFQAFGGATGDGNQSDLNLARTTATLALVSTGLNTLRLGASPGQQGKFVLADISAGNVQTDQWQLYKIAGDATLYLRDLVNSKMQATFTAGAGAGGGSTELNSALQVDGHSGFNGTAPIAKPTVSGSRGSNAALASLLTALANYGLITDSSS